MFSTVFWIDAAERAAKTFAQALISVLAVGTPIFDIAWVEGLGIAATAAVASLLTSIASTQVGSSDSAAALTEVSSGLAD